MRKKTIPCTKVVKTKGKTYVYFDTGRKSEAGRPILVRLPDIKDPSFGVVYAARMAARSREENAVAQPGELTVVELSRLYQTGPQWRDLAASTRKYYELYLRKFVEALPTAPAGRIERKDLVLLMDKMAATPAAANTVIRVVGALYAWARERGHVTNNPTADIVLFDQGEHEPWPQPLVDAALAADDDRVRLATHLLLYTAQRIGDVLRMGHASLRDGCITVRQQKTGKTLSIPVHEKLAAELARTPKTALTFIASVTGRPLSANRLRECLQAFAAERGHKVVPHGLRKNAVNALLEAGCSAAETAAISGQSLQVVEHYAKARAQGRLATAAVLKWQGNKR